MIQLGLASITAIKVKKVPSGLERSYTINRHFRVLLSSAVTQSFTAGPVMFVNVTYMSQTCDGISRVIQKKRWLTSDNTRYVSAHALFDLYRGSATIGQL